MPGRQQVIIIAQIVNYEGALELLHSQSSQAGALGVQSAAEFLKTLSPSFECGAGPVQVWIMDRRVKKTIDLMKVNLHRDLPLGEMAEAVNVSPAHLRYLFKVATGVSLAQYLKFLRMQEAKRLLQSTFLNVKEIKFRVGINDESHFVRDFKKIYGLTPTQYRALHSRTNLDGDDHPSKVIKSANEWINWPINK